MCVCVCVNTSWFLKLFLFETVFVDEISSTEVTLCRVNTIVDWSPCGYWATRPTFTREGAGMVVPSSFLQSQTAVRVDILGTVALVLLDFLRESDPEVTMGTGLSLGTIVFYRSGETKLCVWQ